MTTGSLNGSLESASAHGSPGSQNVLRFDRREQKFVVWREAAERMLPEIAARLEADPHGDDNGSYQVATLYFDNVDRDAYWERARGVTPRHKLRIRQYGAGGVTFLEVKTRLRRRVVKRRMGTTVEEGLLLCADGSPDRHLEPSENLLLDDIQAMVRARDLEPACLVRYARQAWVGPEDLRVTFDSELNFRADNPADFEDESSAGSLLQEDRLVMEVKYPESIPYWLATLLARHGGVMRRFSKYGHAAELSGLVPLPESASEAATTLSQQRSTDAWNPSRAS